MRAMSSNILKGFEIKSSAPLSRPITRSNSEFFAVSKMTGSRLVSGAARSFFKICSPSSSGSMISSSTSSAGCCSIARQNFDGSEKPSAAKPWLSRP